MITIKKHSLIITIHSDEPSKYLASLNKTLLRVNRRMLNSDDLFNDPDIVDNIDILMRLKEELLVEKSPKKEKK